MAHGADSRVKELAELMVADHSAILYSLQELSSAGTGSVSLNANAQLMAADSAAIMAAKADAMLNSASGSDFDTLWVSQMLMINQSKLDELTQAMATAYNPQLKMAIKEAIPKIKKHRDQLASLNRSIPKMLIQKKKMALKKTPKSQ